MLQVAGDYTFRMAGQRRFEERFIALIRQSDRQRIACHGFAFGSDLIQENMNLLLVELKFRPRQDLGIFPQNSRIEAERQGSGCDHADNFAQRTERRKKSRDQDIRIDDDVHRRRVFRTAVISAVIS
jgi:hypothetical protein